MEHESHPAGESQLDELLACERELEQEDARARAEAGALVEEARSEAARAEADLRDRLSEAIARERERIRAEAGAEVRAILTEAASAAARYDAVPPEEVDRLARLCLRRLLPSREEAK